MAPDTFVIVEEKELEKLEREASTTIELQASSLRERSDFNITTGHTTLGLTAIGSQNG